VFCVPSNEIWIADFDFVAGSECLVAGSDLSGKFFLLHFSPNVAPIVSSLCAGRSREQKQFDFE
jgi:hypothetical protein